MYFPSSAIYNCHSSPTGYQNFNPCRVHIYVTVRLNFLIDLEECRINFIELVQYITSLTQYIVITILGFFNDNGIYRGASCLRESFIPKSLYIWSPTLVGNNI